MKTISLRALVKTNKTFAEKYLPRANEVIFCILTLYFCDLWLCLNRLCRKISSQFIFPTNMFTVLLVCTQYLEKQNSIDLAKRRLQTPWEHVLSCTVFVRLCTLIECKSITENQSAFIFFGLDNCQLYVESMAQKWYIIMLLSKYLQRGWIWNTISR